jgi:hypothetical protein
MKIERGVSSYVISPENPTGEPGGACRNENGPDKETGRELNMKKSAWVPIRPGEILTLAEIDGPGIITRFWMTVPNFMMDQLVIRMYWDDEEEPSVEVPAGAFFCDNWLERPLFESKVVALKSANGYVFYWRMPYRVRAKVTLENVGGHTDRVYWAVSGYGKPVDKDEGYFHATWRRSNPLCSPPLFELVDGIRGTGCYVGTALAIQPNMPGWWGEGEPHIFLNGDGAFPTIAYTGTEDYVEGAWNFDVDKRYKTYSGLYSGFHLAVPTNKIYEPYQRFSMYRWHLPDKIWFDGGLRFTLQVIGAGVKYVPGVDADISGMSVWYQLHPYFSPQRSLALQARERGYKSLADYIKVQPQVLPELSPGARKYQMR